MRRGIDKVSVFVLAEGMFYVNVPVHCDNTPRVWTAMVETGKPCSLGISSFSLPFSLNSNIASERINVAFNFWPRDLQSSLK